MSDKRNTVMLVPFVSNPGALFVGLREVRADKVVLICPESKRKDADLAVADLEKFKIGHETISLKGSSLDELFAVFTDMRNKYREENLVVNLGCSDKALSCAALSASFVNGFPSFDVQGDSIEPMPVLKFDYYKILSDKKLILLQKISEKDSYSSLEELAKSAGMSLPLISYYVRGMKTNEGLVQMGLVEVSENGGKLKVSISPLGRLLLKGYVRPPDIQKKRITLR